MSSLLRSSTALGWAAAFLGPALISSLDVLSNRPSAQLAGFLYLLAVSLAVRLSSEAGTTVSHGLAAAFLAISIAFVYRSFYGMRIGSAR